MANWMVNQGWSIVPEAVLLPPGATKNSWAGAALVGLGWKEGDGWGMVVFFTTVTVFIKDDTGVELTTGVLLLCEQEVMKTTNNARKNKNIGILRDCLFCTGNPSIDQNIFDN
jgi:hypothetical protein